ncbi:unnamed protein product, partial [Mesorhabditis spiculigera]
MTCRALYRLVSQHKSSFRSLDTMRPEYETLNEEILTGLLEATGPRLSMLSLGVRTPEDDEPFGNHRKALPPSLHLIPYHSILIREKSWLTRLHLHRMVLSLGALMAFRDFADTLKELIISGCSFEDCNVEGAELVEKSLVSLVAKCTQLAHLHIDGALEGNHWMVMTSRLLEVLPSTVSRVHISIQGALDIRHPEVLGRLNVEELGLTHNALRSSHLDYLRQMKSLQSLDLSHSQFIDDFSAIAEIPTLRRLYLGSCTRLSDDALMAICLGCPRLSLLHIPLCHQIGSTALQHIRFLFELENISLRGLSRVSAHLIFCLNGLPNLQEVDISDCYQLTLSDIELLCEAPAIRLIDIRGIRLPSHTFPPNIRVLRDL